jgi:hypothetical protein
MEVSVLAQFRYRRVVFGVRSGIQTRFTSFDIHTDRASIQWGHVRWLLALELGFGI